VKHDEAVRTGGEEVIEEMAQGTDTTEEVFGGWKGGQVYGFL
jgi:hypothetical protein